MNEMAIDTPDVFGSVRSVIGACFATPRGKLIAASIALALLAVAAVLLFKWNASEVLSPETLRELPARPQDMEKHGDLARTTLAPGDARARNLQVAFAPRAGDVARPFDFIGSEVDRARAVECLATAALYEAGDDITGQQAVAQVVLNRVRHPAFPGTVCGVVWQGTVGLATHYHTDWVYPYWSPSLRKLAKVGTHLFFGWPGTWGGPKAFGKAYRGNETVGRWAIAAMPGAEDEAGEMDGIGQEPMILGLPQAPAKLPKAMGNVPLYGNKVKLVGSDGRSFGLLAPPGISASQVVNAALALCGQPGPCRVNAWDNEDDIPGSYPLPALTRSTMVFEYVRSGAGGGATTRFDCTRFPNKDPKSCLASSKRLPDVLSGVRFK